MASPWKPGGYKHLSPIHLSLLGSAGGMSRAGAELPYFTMLGTRAAPSQYSFSTSQSSQGTVGLPGRWLQQVQKV